MAISMQDLLDLTHEGSARRLEEHNLTMRQGCEAVLRRTAADQTLLQERYDLQGWSTR